MRHPYFTHFQLREPLSSPSSDSNGHDVKNCTSQWEAGMVYNLRKLQSLEVEFGQRWLAVRFEDLLLDPGQSTSHHDTPKHANHTAPKPSDTFQQCVYGLAGLASSLDSHRRRRLWGLHDLGNGED